MWKNHNNRNKKLGEKGEKIAEKFLEKKNYKILSRRFKAMRGEIDLIAMDKNILVFIEVKTRIDENFGLPEESVTIHKQNQIRKIAECYLKKYHMENSECRFDVIGIIQKNRKHYINHIKNAF
ncbi:MAG: YraN family protein [Acidobacteriota bacterium]